MLKEIRLKISTKLICLSGVAALIGCQSNTGSVSSGDVNNSATGNSAINKKIFVAGSVSVDALGVLPISAKSNSSYLMRINNHSKEKYTLQKVEVSNNLLTVNAKSCIDLVPGASCSVELIPHTAVSGDAVVKFNLKDSNGKTKQLEELVRMNAKLHSKSGVSMQNGFTEVVAADGNYSLAMPLQLEQDYDNITALNGNLVCSGNNFKAGNSCTYLMEGRALADNTLVNTGLTLTRNGHTTATAYASLLVRTAQFTNLIISYGTEISVDNKEIKHVTISNEGSNPVKISKVDYEAPLLASETNNGSGQAECVISNDLAPNTSCSLYFKADPAKLASDGKKNNAEISVAYTDTNGENSSMLKTNVSLIYPASQTPNLSLQDTQKLVNKVVGAKYEEAFELTNSGAPYTIDTIKLNGDFDFKRVPPASSDTTSCKDGTLLATNQTCNIVISFEPKRAIRGSLAIAISGTYPSNGKPQSYRFTPGVEYSALTADDVNVISLSKIDDMRILTSNSNNRNPGYVAKSVFKLTNTAPQDRELVLNDFTFANSPLGLSTVPTGDECSKNMALNKTITSCKGFVVFGPRQTATNGSESSSLNIVYTPQGSNAQSVKVSSNIFILEAHDSAAVIVADVTLQSRPEFSNQADGTFNDVINFLALKGDRNKLKLRYTFTNYGNQNAEKFSVLAGGLPYYAKVGDSSTCAYAKLGGAVSLELGVGKGCYLDIELPRDDRFEQLPNSVFGDVQLGYSYNDISTGSNSHQNITALKRAHEFSREWVSITAKPQSVVISPDLSGWLAEITVAASTNLLLATSTTNIYPITVKAIGDGPQGNDSLSNAEVTACQINRDSDTCTVKIKLASDLHGVGEEIKYTLQLSSNAAVLSLNSFNLAEATIDLFAYKLAYLANNNGNGFDGDLATQAKTTIDDVYDDISGIDAADLICNYDANMPAGSNRGFFAALASAERGFCDSGECVYEPSTTYYNTDRQKMFVTDANGLPTGTVAIEAGLVGSASANIWLGYSASDIAAVTIASTDNCNNWTSGAASFNSSIAGLSAPWLSGATSQCNQKHAIMCIER